MRKRHGLAMGLRTTTVESRANEAKELKAWDGTKREGEDRQSRLTKWMEKLRTWLQHSPSKCLSIGDLGARRTRHQKFSKGVCICRELEAWLGLVDHDGQRA